jgi:hypothetical protein
MAIEADAGRLSHSHKIGGRRALWAFAAVLLAAAGIFLLIKLIGGNDHKSGKLSSSSTDGYSLTYPNSWRPLSSQELAKLPGQPLAVVRRKDGKGFVVLRKEGRSPKNFTTFSAQLSKALDKQVPDFQMRSSKVIDISAGKAFFFSYIRKSKGTVHTVVLVPAGKHSYVLNTVSQGGAQDVARQVARIILSFKN